MWLSYTDCLDLLSIPFCFHFTNRAYDDEIIPFDKQHLQLFLFFFSFRSIGLVFGLLLGYTERS